MYRLPMFLVVHNLLGQQERGIENGIVTNREFIRALNMLSPLCYFIDLAFTNNLTGRFYSLEVADSRHFDGTAIGQ